VIVLRPAVSAFALLQSLLSLVSIRVVQEPSTGDQITVWAGVYTVEQAARGRDIYTVKCRDCHGEDLSGHDGPGLTGDRFRRQWETDTLKSLFATLRRMPQDDPGSISDDMRIDLVAYILSANGFPPGPAELRSDPDRLQRIRITRQAGEAIPNFSLVSVTGCLAGTPRSWKLVNATDPRMTKEPGPSDTRDLGVGEASNGTHAYELMQVYPSPEMFVGQRVEVKGLLIRGPNGDALNVTSFQRIETSCAR
jgi:hypothetical protein